MGLFDRFRKRTTADVISVSEGDFYGSWKLSTEEHERILGLSEAEMWRTQPYLRTVVTFLARNIAQLGLQAFQRVGETDRQRLRDGSLYESLRRPNRSATAYELIYGLVADLALYDNAYWMLTPDAPDNRITRLPVGWVSPKGGDALGPEWYEVRVNDRGESVRLKPDKILAFHGWHPSALTAGSSSVHALREILAEQVQASRYREKVWERGGKVGAVITRPAGAPLWSDDARKQFKADWNAKFTGRGDQVGGTPMLEDGMSLNRVDFSAHELEFIEGARLALNTVASVYHINPTMIGLLDNANFANVREFRKMLYGDTLGPILAQIEDRINTFLVPLLDDRDGVYVEFNIEEKLQGNFEEQSAAIQTSTGAPWMTRNEARALRNMPAIDGGDEIVTPLNVLIGSQASPTDSGTQNEEPKTSPPPAVKAAVPSVKALTDPQSDQIRGVFDRYFQRQSAVVLSALGAGESDWFDKARWDTELRDDLVKVSHTIAGILGPVEAERLGYADGFNADQTVNFLTEVCQQRAEGINNTTHEQLSAAMESDGDPATVFDTAKNDRARTASESLGVFVAGFAVHEAAQQIAAREGTAASKTWVTGPNPRPEHSAMNGETVPVDEPFSNGQMWPGSGATADDAGCNCTISASLS